MSLGARGQPREIWTAPNLMPTWKHPTPLTPSQEGHSRHPPTCPPLSRERALYPGLSLLLYTPPNPKVCLLLLPVLCLPLFTVFFCPVLSVCPSVSTSDIVFFGENLPARFFSCIQSVSVSITTLCSAHGDSLDPALGRVPSSASWMWACSGDWGQEGGARPQLRVGPSWPWPLPLHRTS